MTQYLKVSEDDVAVLARLYGLTIEGDDLREVTVRLDGLFSEMQNLDKLDLSKYEPIPICLPVEDP